MTHPKLISAMVIGAWLVIISGLLMLATSPVGIDREGWPRIQEGRK